MKNPGQARCSGQATRREAAADVRATCAKHAAIKVGRYAHVKPFQSRRRSLKKLRTWLDRVIREGRRKVSHPNIVTAHDAGEHQGVHFLVMEHVVGEDLMGSIQIRPTDDSFSES